MKLIVAGSRHLTLNYEFIEQCRQAFALRPSEIVSGGASGVDRSAETFSEAINYPISIFRANWNKHGKAAGPIRNAEMADYADALLLIWDGRSRGSASMKAEMKKRNKPIYEVILKEQA